jgi:CheY-like chemotaxis protein/HPt (histidine-containing phosphotransfer) domain-containing protein
MVTMLSLGAFALALSVVGLDDSVALAGGAVLMMLPLGLRPNGREDTLFTESGQDNAEKTQDAERRRQREIAPDHGRGNLHAVLEGCPVGAAIVAHGQLRFANSFFIKNTQLEPGAEGLRVVLDSTASETRHADPSDKNAALFWNVPDGNEFRIRLIARTSLYEGENAFFLWLTGFAGDAARHAALHFAQLHMPEPASTAPPVPPNAQQAAEPSITDMPVSPDPSASGAPSAKSRARILLAEDNEINQLIATELLEHACVEVEVASNGKEAVDLFLTRDFDLILMDIQMPVMDGTDATRAIRASGKAGADTVPILAMTAHAMSSDREKSLTAGMNDHLTKPIDPQLLYAALNAWLPEGVGAAVEKDAGVPTSAMAPPSAPDPGSQSSPAEAQQQDAPFSLQGIDTQAGLSNVANNKELYLRLLNRFANNYRSSGVELRDALQRMTRDVPAHEEAVRLAHTAKGVAANLGARALAAVAGELESAIKKKIIQEETLARYDQLLSEVLDSIASLPKQDDALEGQKDVSAADKERLAAVLDALPSQMQEDWYGAQQKLLALTPIVEGTVVFTHFREIATAFEEFDYEGVAAKGRLLLDAI